MEAKTSFRVRVTSTSGARSDGPHRLGGTMESPEVRKTVAGDHNILTATGDIRINYHLPPAEAEERRILLQLAESVKRFWIQGVLERSLHEAAMLELRKEPISDAVQHPW